MWQHLGRSFIWTHKHRKSSLGSKDQKWEACKLKLGLLIFLEIIVISNVCFQWLVQLYYLAHVKAMETRNVCHQCVSLDRIHALMFLFPNRRTEDLASPLWRGTLRVELRFRVYLKWKDTQAKYVLHTAANGSCMLYSWFLIKILIFSMQEDCMKPGDKLLTVNGESVLGYTVEKVHCVIGNQFALVFLM